MKPEANKKTRKSTKTKKKRAAPKPRKDRSFSFQEAQTVSGGTEEDARKFCVTREPVNRPTPPAVAFEDLGQLPPSYGTNYLYVTARDPEWLFAYWDVDWSEHTNNIKEDKVFLRVVDADGNPLQEAEISPHARNWYLHAPAPGIICWAELGFLRRVDGRWQSVCRSNPASIPGGALAEDEQAAFATIPFHVTFDRLMESVQDAMQTGESLVHALSRLESEDGKPIFGGRAPDWTESQRRILEALLGKEIVERIGADSGQIDRLLRRELEKRLHSESASGALPARHLAALAGVSESSLASPFGASWSAQPFGRPREFFLHVNAEVIFYGGTHPDAKVRIDGKEVQLGPDGSFRYHFRFPDGDYEIPIVAESPDGAEQRSAILQFRRNTTRRGEVGQTRQPPGLENPLGPKG